MADSLAGRLEILHLRPFSQGELAGVREGLIDRLFAAAPLVQPSYPEDKAAIVARVLTGGYPGAVDRQDLQRRNAWFGAYITTILQRDVRDLAHIERLSELPDLLSLLAARTGSLLNFASLARDVAVSQSSLKRYMALLEATFLVEYLPAWSANLGKRLIKAPKVMLTDTGLIAYLLGLAPARLETDSMLLGPLLETFVAVEFRKQASWSETQPHLFHCRFATGQEVDLLLEAPSGGLVGIEVKAAASVGASDFRGLKNLADVAGSNFKRGIVLYLGTELVPFGANLFALPVSALWSSGS